VRQLLVAQPQAGRSGLARDLCVQWQWRAASGRWKVRSALAILTELERQGWIRLRMFAEATRSSRHSPERGI
jgi:cysteine synthase